MEYTRPEPGFPLRNAAPRSADDNPAGALYQRLLQWVSEFDKSLDEEYEVGVRWATPGQSISFHLAGIGYCNPALLRFVGATDEGESVELIQHVSQVNLMLVKMRRLDPDQAKSTFGLGSGW
ncbi:MAG: hypothetical protein C0617_13560 [Desulfuromonas sp.]|uniref:DUF6173 family protein n=1 Tax=Desulfuromonas sp. TaxID=892 RepID=UPI000CBD284D|nr:DUF6173 family protein [Desulfuromonas sp.]PLX82669.1 MAG: hypothetical protein C0617_13560 [Desulfuromonas sp.]